LNRFFGVFCFIQELTVERIQGFGKKRKDFYFNQTDVTVCIALARY